MILKKILYCVIILLFSGYAHSQDVSVIFISGDAYTSQLVDGKEQYVKIVYGPIKNAEKIILKDKAELRLVNTKNEIAELHGESTHNIMDLTFQAVEANSVFSKFCSYFSTFFTDHSSAESKAHYQNNIYAISRGNVPAPLLDFPLPGQVPFDGSHSLPFSWTHACDSCEYIVNIYNFKTRSIVYAWTTKENSVLLERPGNYLNPDTKYYWNVSISGEEMDYQNTIFTMAQENDYQHKIDQLEAELKMSTLPISIATKSIYVMSDFENQDLINYSIYYGLRQKELYPENTLISDFLERFWFDDLLDR